jgi:sugar phosphate isomerase/epimerase
MNFIDRIGIDIGRRLPLEEAISWAARNGVRHIDIQLDTAANAVNTFDDARCTRIRSALEQHGVDLALHTLSAVNVAEYSPYVGDGVEAYLRSYVEVAPKLGAQWIVVHAGYHFGSDRALRMQSGKDRLKRIVAYAEKHKSLILLENLNKEPADAEVHYLAHNLEEWQYYWDIASPAFKLSFTANHAHLVPEGIGGFVAALDFARVGEVRLADCFRNGKEQHLIPGRGDLDFAAMFRLIEDKGFRGTYTNAFGTLDDMLAAREVLAGHARDAGVATA